MDFLCSGSLVRLEPAELHHLIPKVHQTTDRQSGTWDATTVIQRSGFAGVKKWVIVLIDCSVHLIASVDESLTSALTVVFWAAVWEVAAAASSRRRPALVHQSSACRVDCPVRTAPKLSRPETYRAHQHKLFSNKHLPDGRSSLTQISMQN